MNVLFIENNTDKVMCIYNGALVPDEIYNTYKVVYDGSIPNIIHGKELYYDRNYCTLHYRDVNTLENQLMVLHNEYNSRIAALTEDVPNYEIQTWDRQEQEAAEFVLNNLADTPLIDSICTARNIDKNTFCNKVLDKAMKYTIAVGTLIGERQAKEKDIKGSYETNQVVKGK